MAIALGCLLLGITHPAIAASQPLEHLTIAVKDNLRPLGFRDAQGNLQGFEIDIARRLASELLEKPDRVILQPVTNQEKVNMVANHQADLAIAHITATEVRSRLVNFSPPYYIDGTTFITRNPLLKTLEDIGKAKIAVLEHSSTIASVKYFIANAQLIGVSSYQQALELLETNQADCFAADASVLTGWVQQYPGYQIVPFFVSAEAIAIALPKGLQSDRLRQQVNQAIERWREEGWLKARAQFWGLPIPQ